MAVSTSMRFGSTPIWKTMPGVARSAGPSAARGAPKRCSAARTRGGLSPDGFTHTSRSRVKRGAACTASAYPPTRRYSAPSAFNAANRSLKSGFTGIGGPPGEVFEDHVPGEFQPAGGRHPRPEFPVEGAVIVVQADDARDGSGTPALGIHAIIIPQGLDFLRFTPDRALPLRHSPMSKTTSVDAHESAGATGRDERLRSPTALRRRSPHILNGGMRPRGSARRATSPQGGGLVRAILADPSGGPSRSRGDQDHAAADAIKRTDRELESHRPPRLSSWLGSTASSCRSASGLGLIPTKCAPWSTGFGRTAGREERSGGPPRNPGSKKGVLYKRTPIL